MGKSSKDVVTLGELAGGGGGDNPRNDKSGNPRNDKSDAMAAAVVAVEGLKLRPGMKCPRARCHGVIRCISSHITKRDPVDGSQWRIQMLQCGSCGKPSPSEKRTIPACYANERPKKAKR